MELEEITMHFEEAQEKMDHSIEHLRKELAKISTERLPPIWSAICWCLIMAPPPL